MGLARLSCATPLLALRAGIAGRGRVAASSRVFRGLCTSGPSGSDGSDAQDDGVVAEMPLAADIHAADGENESDDVGAIVEQAVERNRRGVMSWAGVGDDDDDAVDGTSGVYVNDNLFTPTAGMFCLRHLYISIRTKSRSLDRSLTIRAWHTQLPPRVQQKPRSW